MDHGARRILSKPQLTGRWYLTRIDRETGEVISRDQIGSPNAVQTDGKVDMLRALFGTGSFSDYNQTNTKLQIYTSGPTLNRTLDCDAAPTFANVSSGGQYSFQFSDISVAVYTVAQCRIYNNASSVTFSSSTPSFIGGNDKPNTQNWIYTYVLSFTTGSDPYAEVAGLRAGLKMLTGDVTTDFGGAHYLIEDTLVSPEVDSNVSLDAGYPSQTSTTVTLQATSADGSTNQHWYNIAFVEILPDLGSTELFRYDSANWGEKTDGMAYIVSFTFAL